MKPLEVLITSGGTITKIDDIRHIGNFSGGSTGARIAEAFLESGASVHYIHSKHAKRPFRSQLALDPNKNLEDEIMRLHTATNRYLVHANRLHEYVIQTFAQYHDTLERVLKSEPIDVVVLAAAVSDYGARHQKGKISSSQDKMTIELEKLPKVIGKVKEWKLDVYQVGFKLLADVDDYELIGRAYEHGLKSGSDLTVANSVRDGNFNKRHVYFVMPQRFAISVPLVELGPRLVRAVYDNIRSTTNEKSYEKSTQ
ncbi:MAG: hypothetical protein KKG59_03775 [Nanoarchaeota archaeon]|nr:hypothetical protein [Nanoarchaeota archaeon]